MKIIMNPDELVQFIQSGTFPESCKKQMVGSMMAQCSSEEMEKAMVSKVEGAIKDAVDAALKTNSTYYNQTISGWAKEIVINNIKHKLGAVDVKEVIRSTVAEEVNKAFTNQLQATVRDIIKEEYMTAILRRTEMIDMQAIIKKNIAAVFGDIATKG